MHQVQDEQEPGFVYRLLTTLLLLGLLLEWLVPWLHTGEWSVLLQPQALIWMTVAMLLLGLMRPRLYWFIAVGIVAGVLGLYIVFRGEGQNISQWLLQLIPSLGRNVSDMLHYGIWYMSDEFRTLLLFTGWLLLAPALQSMVWHYQLSLALAAATIVYLIALHMSLGIDIWFGLLRAIGEGLLLIALTTQHKLQRYQLTVFKWGSHYRYQFAGIALLAAIIVAGGFIVSDNKDKRSEPIAWTELFSNSVAEELVAWSQQSGGMPLKNVTSSNYRSSTAAVTGYDHDDSLLGQSLQPSDQVVFYGWSARSGYWRGETQATYTGRGWSNQGGAVALHKIADDEEAALLELGSKGKGERIQQTISYVEPMIGMPLLQTGTKGVVLQLQASKPERELSSYVAESATGVLYPPVTDAAIKGYTLLTELPAMESGLLNELAEPREELAQRVWESDMLSAYLQLPSELPERIAALAAEVSGGGWTSRYDQVKAIEQYLKENYKYSLKSKVPDENEDFVDHFLFQQQQGYCVHFATAMVVMLRTQDIPARFVKGYQSGEVVGERTNEAGMTEQQYKVRQQDAHAWVEVYFPEVGWVPFDPTPAAGEQERNASAWLGELKQLGSDAVRTFKDWSSLLSAAQWQWLAATVAAVVVLATGTVISVPKARRGLQLRKYSIAYKQYIEDQHMLEGLLQASCSFPSRNKKRLAWQKLAQDRQHKLEQRLQQAMEWLADDVLNALERKATGQRQQARYISSTWRQRITAIAEGCADLAKREQLAALLAWLEQMHYSASRQPVSPEELQAHLLGLRTMRASTSTSQQLLEQQQAEHQQVELQ